MKHKLLIANRGEIACRIIKTCKRLNIETVAVYSDADSNSLFVRMADEAVNIGRSSSLDSYLNIDKIIAATKKTGATLVHPGYGFLSENYNFVKALNNHNIRFVGPSAESIKVMGDKIESKKIAAKSKVNTIPGYMGIIKNVVEAKKIAKQVGFPVMIKASAGGGGKGMRVVYNKDEVEDAFISASNEARNSFSDDRIFIEKFIEKPRHIEIQLLGDKFGNILCLGERECSIQRNNQKVIEEAPSVFLDEKTRKKMYQQTRALAKKVNYYSAGTVEYIMDKNKNFYFLEMNTRLQVEHPVTELITGLDIVEMMISIALDNKIQLTQKDINLKGWAMEARIYAEDPSRGFLPSSGRINLCLTPEENKNIRIDTGIYEGGEISMFYDPMIAKLCSYGKNRNDAIQYMTNALGEFNIEGVSHNISFLETIMQNKNFIKGNLSTSFIREEFPVGFSGNVLDSKSKTFLVSTATFIFIKNFIRNSLISSKLKIGLKQINDRWVVIIDDQSFLVRILKINNEKCEIDCNNENIKIISHWHNGNKLFRGKINDQAVAIKIKQNNLTGEYLLQYLGSDTYVNVYSPRVAELSKFLPKSSIEEKDNNITSPISGRMVKIKVKEGDKITIGQDVVTIEAMKMENIIKSNCNGIVEKISLKEGDLVTTDQLIVKLKN